MEKLLTHFKKMDWIMAFSAVLLVCFGLLSLYHSSLSKGDLSNFTKQVFFLAIGFLVMILFSFLDWRSFRDDPYFILTLYFISLLALFFLFFFAPEIRGTQRWYKVGEFSIDPIEFAKVILIILLAKYFSLRHVEMYQVKHIFLSGFFVLLPFLLVFLQPNFGSAMILVFIWVGVLMFSGIKLRHFLTLCFIFILALSIGWQFFLKDYQKERIISFAAPQMADPLGAGWNQAQARIAIGSGGIFGKGFGQGTQTHYGFLPEPQTDFIFSAIAEETGLLGVSILFLLFWILLWRVMRIAILSENNFSRLFAMGFSVLLVTQIFINIGMNVAILPVIGNPLPLVSYGGNSVIFTFLSLGLLQSIKTH